MAGQDSLIAFFWLIVIYIVSSILIYGSGWNVANEHGAHFECIFPIPFCTSNRILIYWFLANLTMGIPIFFSLCKSEKNYTGFIGLIESV